MKICQEKNNKIKQKKQFKRFNKKIAIFLIFCFSLSFISQPINVAMAVGLDINVHDTQLEIKESEGIMQDMKNWLSEWDSQKALAALKKATAIGYKKALSYFLNDLAYNTAIYLATGDKGQSPMFETDNIGDYLKNTADNAAGTFLESLGKENGYIDFNVCEPDFNLKLKIGLGLFKTQRPSAPECTFTKMVENWDNELDDPDFLNKFQDMFNPWSNDLSIALSLQTGMTQNKNTEEHWKSLNYQINQGIRAVTDPISGKIKTPSQAVGTQLEKTINKANENYFVYTGDAIADAVSVFIDTLSGKLIEEWLKKGLVTDFPDNSYKGDWGGFAEEKQSSMGLAGAKARFRVFLEPDFNIRGDYDILAELVSCLDPDKAGPTNCVIDDNFKEAIINRLTVSEAIEQGYLNGSYVFGFQDNDREPEQGYMGSYPYRSMPILRKFRIIPVGWEEAALKIFDNRNEPVTLDDIVACHSQTDDYAGFYESWCRGLVDPNWVLKAPLNYCKREGPGPEIISTQVMGEEENSQISILRNSNYCADEQSCIKEKNDGSCEYYGYCTGERRTWRFDSESCEPKYNTCETFRNSEGQTASYLANSLDYGICNADNVGCQAYCTDFDYSADNWTCTQTTGDKLYFDKDAKECDEDDEGCHEFIRTKAGLGANLLTNSSFEDDLAGTIWESDGVRVNDGYFGYYGMQLSANLSKPIAIGLADYSISGETYSLSFYAKNCSAGDNFKINGQASSADLADGSDWQYYQTAHIFPESSFGNVVSFEINSNICVIDAIKLERSIGLAATVYTDYRGTGVVYEKLLPDYLESACYANPGLDYAFQSGAPDECYDFARKCNKEEVGCELYTSVSDGAEVPAKVSAWDYCPSECVGYDAYIQQETIFDSTRNSYFIPETAQTCGAEASGCDEFTNLDEVELGGEAREYYIYLRQCVKPSDPAANCSEFYTWEGSDESGFQLKVFNLQTEGIGVASEPELTEDDSLECDSTIYNLPATDPAYNSDCREFYNSSGGLSYHLYTRTISCSADCHPYRRTKLNTDPLIDQALCVGDDKHWDSANGVCVVCKNSGYWSDQHGACLYDAIPDQGTECSASENGCREYSGNTGNNVMVLMIDDFEDGTNENWAGEGLTTVVNSNESIIAGGHSLFVSGGTFSASKEVGLAVKNSKSYVLSFIAKANNLTNFTASFENGSGDIADFSAITLNYNWQRYTLSMAGIGHEIDAVEKLLLAAGNDFYIDDIKLIEIVDRYYLIKDSWNTPDSCNQDIKGDPYPLYAVGCDQYYDRDNTTHYLKSFTKLCYETAVGCEILIDTNNYSDYQGEAWNDGGDGSCVGDPGDCVEIGADKFTYAVYDREKECGSDEKGCQRLGDPYNHDSNVVYDDTYLINNPNDYGSILCLTAAVGCQEYASGDSSVYFKDPGDEVCEWRQSYKEVADSWRWLKKKIKRCDNNNDGLISAGVETNICLSDSNCSAGGSCINDNNDYDCPVSDILTFGYGGEGLQVYQPSGWAGICPASEAGCSELIDPISKFSHNLIFNNDFSQDADLNGVPDGWTANVQNIDIESYALYRLAGSNNAGTIEINCPDDIYQLDENNSLSNIGNSFTLQLSPTEVKSAFIYSDSNTSCTVDVSIASGEVELRKSIIDYQIDDDLDKSSCNGLVDFEEGCVLFNERTQEGSSLAGLTFDANLTISDGDGASPAVGAVADRNANQLIKVRPDRVCAEWLACRSSMENKETGEHQCYSVGNCVDMNPSGQCQSFVNYSGIHNFEINKDQDTTGYAIMDQYYLGDMEEVGAGARVGNGSFERYDSDNYPLDWYLDGDIWDPDYAYVINNPYEAEMSGIIYPADGWSLLKLGAGQRLVSNSTQIQVGQDYYLSYMVNTYNLSSSNNDAKAQIVLAGGASETFEANESVYGWQTKTEKFTPTGGFIEISLQADSVSGALLKGSIYFDNIRITPVIETTGSDFVPKTCRLYPAEDSLTCDSYDMVKGISKGMEGYCLQYDSFPGNMDACTMWYPVDRIKSSSIIERGVGYDGKFPVYYCADMDADFDFVERRTTNLEMYDKSDCVPEGIWSYLWNWAWMFFTWMDWWQFLQSTDDYNAALSLCGDGYDYEVVVNECIKDCTYSSSWLGVKLPGKQGYIYAYCVPTGGDDLVISQEGNISDACASQSTPDGWYVYDGDYNVNEETNYDPPVMVYNYTLDQGTSYDGTIGNGTADNLVYPKDYLLQCDKFYQVVSDTADNKAWTGRVRTGSNYVVSELGGYVYGDEDPPFGSALQPTEEKSPEDWDGISSTEEYDRLVFRENLSETVISGLPYGCHGVSCGAVGRCSNHEEILCAHPYPGGAWDYGVEGTDEHYLDLQCPPGETCNLISNLGITTPAVAKDVISSLFVESYRTVVWDWNTNRYDIDNITDNILPPANCSPVGTTDRYTATNGPTCRILPIVGNETLEGGSGNIIWDGVSGSFTIPASGYYTLKFTSRIDEEQLPLTRIDINWADGNIDSPAAYGELNDRPTIEEPHEFIHYYTIGTYSGITITLTDNWGTSASN